MVSFQWLGQIDIYFGIVEYANQRLAFLNVRKALR